VTGSTFVAYCGVGDNDVTERQSRNDSARTAAGDELPAAGGNRVLKESAGQWGPDAWMEHSNVATPDVQPQRLYQR
jgi:hypothetical protein